MRELYVIAGPNGAGKTTLIRTFSNNLMERDIDVAPNPDDPSSPHLSAFEKQRIMREYIDSCLSTKKSVLFETTGAGKSSVLKMMKRARDRGYQIIFWYLWLPNAQLAIERVRVRFRERRSFCSGTRNKKTL